MKKPIAIVEENKEAIREALKAVNGRAESFTITHYYEVERVAKEAEEALAMLPKAARVGARCSFVPAGPSAKAYKHNAKTTRILIERKSKGWILVAIEEEWVRPKEKQTFGMHVTREQRDEIARRAVAGFALIKS